MTLPGMPLKQFHFFKELFIPCTMNCIMNKSIFSSLSYKFSYVMNPQHIKTEEPYMNLCISPGASG